MDFAFRGTIVRMHILPLRVSAMYIDLKLFLSHCLIVGPTNETINDFWRMIWEKRLGAIVMLTRCIEEGRVSKMTSYCTAIIIIT